MHVPALLAAAVALLAGASAAWGEEPGAKPVPALLVGHLRVADQACLEAIGRLPGVTPDQSPRWAGGELHKVTVNLIQARETTVDPGEQERLERLAGDAHAIRRDLRGRSGDAALRLARLRNEIRRFADEVQRRIELARTEPVPVTRPPLAP